ncbi:tetratricopeptide repeat protein [Lacimicrobium sp. SS2-24]|uniref:tetratricopeptide repeat protein n=1 Tax=Lacimicrobium sp. SS2-24 TaxID=2005569 RepID=UPI001130F1FD|nr:tetratricopeptide repeat protein [Lacimicrobium sp. SS2-24]
MIFFFRQASVGVVFFLFCAFAEASCFDLEWKRGRPYDYYANETRVATQGSGKSLLYFVEHYHFTPEVRSLIKGTTTALPGDILFVLNSIPNHPGALDAYSRYEKRYQTSPTFQTSRNFKKPQFKADCFFERADRVFPAQAETLMVWGLHEYRNERLERAKRLLERAIELKPNYIEAHYNIGLVLIGLNQPELAEKHADIAYDAGYPLPGLREKLTELKQE